MSQVIDIEISSVEGVLKILRSLVDDMPPSPTSSRYRRAVDSLHSSLLSLHSSLDSSPFTLDSLRRCITDWLVNQWLLQTPYSTASLYLDIISALYTSAVRADRLPKTKVFSEVKAQLKALGPDGWKSGIDDEIFQRALRLTKNVDRLLLDDAIAANLILLSLTSSLTPITDLAQLRIADLIGGGSSSSAAPASAIGGGSSSSATPASAIGEGSSSSATPASAIGGGSSSSAAGPSPHCVASEDLRLKTEDSNNTAPPADTAEGRYCEADTKDQVLSLIFNNLSLGSARRRYVFPLRQDQRTELQLKKHIAKICNALFRRARLPQATDPMQTVEALWAYAALRTGVPASTLVRHLDCLHPGHAPLGLPILKLCKSSVFSLQSSEEDRGSECGKRPPGASSHVGSNLNSSPLTLNSYEKNFASIGKIFLDNPPRWYAMSLRPGVRFTQLCRRLELLKKPEGSSLRPENLRLKTEDLRLFYPCEEIARAIGKKIVIRQRPFIHSVVFFQAKLTDIGPLFAKIGDLAWCYRQSAQPGAPYAEISDAQFRLFQQTIARFTPDYEVASTGELELKKDDKVVILGGLFAGHTATVVGMGGGSSSSATAPSVSNFPRVQRPTSNAPSTVYRLNIVGENGIEWRIDVDKRLATKAKPEA